MAPPLIWSPSANGRDPSLPPPLIPECVTKTFTEKCCAARTPPYHHRMQLTLAFITSPQDWTMILLIVLLLFGAKKLPELARGVGKSMGEFKRAKDDFESQITKAATELPAEKPPHDKA